MSEQRLKDFGTRAETCVEPPDFAELDHRGRGLRARRRAGAAGTLAVVLTLAGAAVAQIHRDSADPPPSLTPPSHARPYPQHGSTLDAGTYRLRPSVDRHLVAELTVPPGWSAWVGPQAGGRDWYVNALVLEVDRVNTHGCLPDVEPLVTSEQLVDALAHAASSELVRAPQAGQRFRQPATRLRLRVTSDFRQCPENGQATYHSTRDGYIPFAPPGTRLDIWVVEVDQAHVIYVQKAWTPNAPSRVRRQLDAVIDSIRFTDVG